MKIDDDGRRRLHARLGPLRRPGGPPVRVLRALPPLLRGKRGTRPVHRSRVAWSGGLLMWARDASKAYVDLDSGWVAAWAAARSSGGFDHERWLAVLSRHRFTGEAALEFLATHGCGPSRR
jgi:hypothetical protein